MSLTALLWLALFITFTVKAINRPVWALCAYTMAFFALPVGWWWGKGMLAALSGRWSLIAAIVLAGGVMTAAHLHQYRLDKHARNVFMLLCLYVVNATIVHVLFASNATRSYNGLVLLYKQVGLAWLTYLAITNVQDLKIYFYAIVVGAFYVSYEIVFNERGGFEKGRLEGIFIPGAADSNYMAGLFAMCLPLGAALLFLGTWKDRIFAIVSLPVIFDVILRCNSRGTFLALLAGGARVYIATSGRMRRYATIGAILTVLAVMLQAKDPEIAERFWSIFVAAEDRDAAAQSRLDYWEAGMKMIGNYPLGSGSEAAFKSVRGSGYIRHLYFRGRYRGVHNGFLDVAAGWGVQGFLLYASAIGVSWYSMRRAMRHARKSGQLRTTFLGVCIESALVTELVACAFISSLDGEWFFWLMSMMLAYGKIYAPPSEGAGAIEQYQQREVTERSLVTQG